MLILDGNIIDGNTILTKEEYDALPESEKNNGIVYFIIDDIVDYNHRIDEIISLIGDASKLSKFGNNETISNILSIMSSSINNIYFERIDGVYNPTYKKPFIRGHQDYPTPSTLGEKLRQISSVIGLTQDVSTVSDSTSIIDNIIKLDERINGIVLSYVDGNVVVNSKTEFTAGTAFTLPDVSASILDKVTYIENVVGDISKLYNFGHNSCMGCIIDLFTRLNNAVLSVNDSGNLNIEYNPINTPKKIKL